MPSFGFCFRPSVRKGGHPGRVYLRVVHGSFSRSLTLPYRVWSGEWDAGKRRLIVPRSDSERKRQLLDYEDCMHHDLRRMEFVIRTLEKRGNYTIDEIISRYHLIMSGNSTGAYAGKLAAEMERQGHERTARVYRSTATKFIKYNGERDIRLEQITAGMIYDFQQALKSEGRSMNTISFYMRTLRAICNKAIEEGRIARHAENAFAGVFTGATPTRKLALTSMEFARLSKFDPTAEYQASPLPKSLQDALVMFLFCCHARGMCFVDMAYLKKSDIRGDILRYRRRKTGQQIEIELLPWMRRAIHYFAPMTAGSPYLFPVITNPDKSTRLQYESGLALQNQRLKKISALAGICKPLSTHCARHTWATVAKGKGFSLALISEGLGHSNQKTTEIYLALLEQSALDRASRMISEVMEQSWQVQRGRNQCESEGKKMQCAGRRKRKGCHHGNKRGYHPRNGCCEGGPGCDAPDGDMPWCGSYNDAAYFRQW